MVYPNFQSYMYIYIYILTRRLFIGGEDTIESGGSPEREVRWEDAHLAELKRYSYDGRSVDRPVHGASLGTRNPQEAP